MPSSKVLYTWGCIKTGKVGNFYLHLFLDSKFSGFMYTYHFFITPIFYLIVNTALKMSVYSRYRIGQCIPEQYLRVIVFHFILILKDLLQAIIKIPY